MDQTTAIQPATDVRLSTAMGGLREQFHAVASARVADLGAGYTQLEINAMTIVEELRLVNTMDLAAVLLRGDLLREIEEGSLWTVHPGQYSTFQDLAKDQGISLSELSNIRDMTQIIFPYIENVMGLIVAEVWENIGKSNFRELTPVLKALITGEETTGSVRNSIEAILGDIYATAAAGGQEITEGEARGQAVDWLIEQGEMLTNRQLRETVRPTRTPAINPAVFSIGDTRIFMVEMTEDQLLALRRKLGTFMQDEVFMDLSQDEGTRQAQLMRVRPIRRLMDNR